MRVMRLACWAAAVVFLLSGPSSGGPINSNLLVNGGAETGDLSGWTVTANGGNGWAIDLSGGQEGPALFVTSYEDCRRYQEIDLLASGFTAPELDAAPDIAVGEWIASRFDHVAEYYIRVELRDAARNPIATWERGTPAVMLSLPAGTAWFQESHVFSGYGTGLRYVYFEDGGEDASPSWAGYYGARLDSAYVEALPEPASALLLGFLPLCFMLRRRFGR